MNFFSWGKAVYKKTFGISAILMLFTMLFVAPDYGITGDETHLNFYSHEVNKFYKTMGKDTACFNLPVFHDKDRVLKFYGAGFEISATILKKLLPVWEYDARRYANALFGFAAMIFTGLIAFRLAGWRAALVALWIIFLSPRFFGHSMNNPKDIPFAATSAFAVWAMMIYFDKLQQMKVKYILLTGLAIASAINIRFGGLLLFGYFGLFLVIEIIRKNNGIGKVFSNPWIILKPYFFSALFTIIIGYFCGMLLWPYGLYNPFKHPFDALDKFGKLDVSLRQVFEGQFYMSAELPWYYLPKMIGITTPLVFILGLAMALPLFYNFRKNIPLNRVMLVLFAGLFPVFYIIYTKANIFHEWRHTYFAYPPLVAISACSWHLLFNIKSKALLKFVAPTLFFLLLLLPVSWMLKSHPHQYLYYNEFIGGIEKAKGVYVLDYWMNSMKEAYEWTVKNAPLPKDGSKLVITSTAHPQMLEYFKGKEDKYQIGYDRYYQRHETAWDYGLFYADFISPSQLKNPKTWPPDGTVHTIEANGTVIGVVIKRENLEDFYAFEALNANNFQKAIAHFQNALKSYPNSETLHGGLGMAYLNIGNTDLALQHLVKSIQLYPENAQSYFYLGYTYAIQGNRSSATIYLQKAVNLNPAYGKQAQEIINQLR